MFGKSNKHNKHNIGMVSYLCLNKDVNKYVYKYVSPDMILNNKSKFELISNECLVNILSYLETHKNIVLVNKFFYNLISSINFHIQHPFGKTDMHSKLYNINDRYLQKHCYANVSQLSNDNISLMTIYNFKVISKISYDNDKFNEFFKLQHFEHLYISGSIKDKDKYQFVNLQKLKSLSLYETNISTNVLNYLPNLTELNIYKWNVKNDELEDFLNNLNNLRELKFMNIINDKQLCKFKQLKKLELNQSTTITDRGIYKLTNLQTLKIYFVKDKCNIDGTCIKYLINLTTLELYSNNSITDYSLYKTKLKNIKLVNDRAITGSCFKSLSNLKSLELDKCEKIKDVYIQELSNLSIFKYYKKNIMGGDSLDSPHYDSLYSISKNTFKNMNLTKLIIYGVYLSNERLEYIKHLTNLCYLEYDGDYNGFDRKYIEKAFPNIIKINPHCYC